MINWNYVISAEVIAIHVGKYGGCGTRGWLVIRIAFYESFRICLNVINTFNVD